MYAPPFLYGIRVHIPEEWVDFSVYRFAMPKPDEQVPMLATKIKQIQPNMVVTCHMLSEGQTFEHLFDDSNEASAQNIPEFEVIRAGQGVYYGQNLVWQDSTQLEPSSNMKVYQRRIAFVNPNQDIAVFTLTGTRQDLESMSNAIGFNHLEPQQM
jgi:hypothetical protein